MARVTLTIETEEPIKVLVSNSESSGLKRLLSDIKREVDKEDEDKCMASREVDKI